MIPIIKEIISVLEDYESEKIGKEDALKTLKEMTKTRKFNAFSGYIWDAYNAIDWEEEDPRALISFLKGENDKGVPDRMGCHMLCDEKWLRKEEKAILDKAKPFVLQLEKESDLTPEKFFTCEEMSEFENFYLGDIDCDVLGELAMILSNYTYFTEESAKRVIKIVRLFEEKQYMHFIVNYANGNYKIVYFI